MHAGAAPGSQSRSGFRSPVLAILLGAVLHRSEVAVALINHTVTALTTHGPVTLVAPAIAAHPLFTLVFGASLRPQERPTPRERLRETWIFRYKERFHSAVIAKLR